MSLVARKAQKGSASWHTYPASSALAAVSHILFLAIVWHHGWS